MPAAPVLTTDRRLVLEPYAAHHLDAMAEMFGDPEVTAFTYLGRQDREGTARVRRNTGRFISHAGTGCMRFWIVRLERTSARRGFSSRRGWHRRRFWRCAMR